MSWLNESDLYKQRDLRRSWELNDFRYSGVIIVMGAWHKLIISFFFLWLLWVFGQIEWTSRWLQKLKSVCVNTFNVLLCLKYSLAVKLFENRETFSVGNLGQKSGKYVMFHYFLAFTCKLLIWKVLFPR